jgi:hypothetical protein
MNAFSTYGNMISDIQSTGYALFTTSCSPEFLGGSLLPLAIGLIESAALFSLFDPSTKDTGAVRALFDGGETAGPNLDTRLRCIRDLCSASVYSLRVKAFHSNGATPQSCTDDVETPGEHEWVQLISSYACSGDDKAIVETSRLLDDLFEGMVHIARNLRRLAEGMAAGSWNEVYRSACHIRDHCDYAEEMVVACICRAKDEDAPLP